MPINNFHEPFIACCFVSDTKIFVAFFHTPYLTHHHFVWDFEQKVIIGRKNISNSSISMELDCSVRNFPIKCFFNENRNEIYVFYRQGDSFTVRPDDIETYEWEDMFDADLG